MRWHIVCGVRWALSVSTVAAGLLAVQIAEDAAEGHTRTQIAECHHCNA